MRISGATGANATAAAPAARRSRAGAFAPTEAETPRATAAPAALRTIGGIDALLALQGLEDPTERRKLALKRGRRALDALEELKIGLLGGTLSPAILSRLRVAVGDLDSGSGDPRLDRLLEEIALRVGVEIAKMAPR